MHWGVQNGPPYPIGASGHSASEKKAGWKKSLGGGRNEQLYDRNKDLKSAGRAKRRLNKLDQKRAEAQFEANRYTQKQEKFEQKGKSNKAIKAKAKADVAQQQADSYKKAAQDLIKDIEDTSLYEISTRDGQRLVNSGKVVLASTIAGAIAGPVIGVATGTSMRKYENGTYYKVKKSPDKKVLMDLQTRRDEVKKNPVLQTKVTPKEANKMFTVLDKDPDFKKWAQKESGSKTDYNNLSEDDRDRIKVSYLSDLGYYWW